MNNSKARLTFNLNDGKATSYKQTAMNNIHIAEGSNSTKKQVISPRKAVEALYFNRYLKRNDQVLDARLAITQSLKKPTYNYYNPTGKSKSNTTAKTT